MVSVVLWPRVAKVLVSEAFKHPNKTSKILITNGHIEVITDDDQEEDK
jgi:hypothetical protein